MLQDFLIYSQFLPELRAKCHQNIPKKISETVKMYNMVTFVTFIGKFNDFGLCEAVSADPLIPI
jgi:hypothetical protein